jgi:hypothetical protein
VAFDGGKVFAGPAEELPRPPDYPAEAVRHHCRDWDEWFENSVRAYDVGAALGLEVTAGEADVVAVKLVEARVFRRMAMGKVTPIRCDYGAAGYEGYLIDVDTVTQRTRYMNTNDGSEWRDMPPGAIVSRKSDFQGALISVSCLDGYLYEGAVDVAADINGTEVKYSFGNQAKPYRWICNQDGRYGSMPAYDWHPVEKRWVLGLDPSEVLGEN